ncbi:DUF3617 domain-containing protein [Pedomonas sp. V897]|uniref:DUF3617 domain-containing protein n=1 Tax=Pedomonas sp. V897 TaxID=3446482 RepID=UPI003EE0B324
MSRWGVAAIAAGLAVVAIGSKAAAPAFTVKPGLWEMRVTSKMAGAGLPAGLGANTMNFKVCITPDDAKASWEDMVKHLNAMKDECTVSDLQESGGTYSFRTKCKSGMAGTMKGTIKYTTMEQSGEMSTGAGGQAMAFTYNNAARWVADVCPADSLGAPGSRTR